TPVRAARSVGDSQTHEPRVGSMGRNPDPDPESVPRSMHEPGQTKSAASEGIEITELVETPLVPSWGKERDAADPSARATTQVAQQRAPVPSPGPFRPHAGGPRPSARSAQSGDDGQKPDEIQIHIGRVEVTAVTAVPPAPSLAAATPERKSLNLAEYLKRRRGDNR
ncbi:MAG: hypothetical protein WA510_27840, partial [Acidobacteriaceae bacterium]